MPNLPDFKTFQSDYNAGKPQVVWTSLVSDLETPVSAFLKLAAHKKNAFLFESVEGGATRGRYSIIGLDPDLVWQANGNTAQIRTAKAGDKKGFIPCKEDTLTSLRAILKQSHIDLPDNLPPMGAGIFGYMGYDTVRLVEQLPDNNPDDLGLPDSVMIRPTIMAVFDSVKDEITLVTPVRPNKLSAKVAYEHALERLDHAVDKLETPLDLRGMQQAEIVKPAPKPKSNTSPAAYKKIVEKAKDYITEGDIFQVVLSQRFETPFELPPFSLYRALRRTNPSPYLYYLNFDNYSIVGSSPEILVKAQDKTVTIRPIAGTRPRGKDKQQDQQLAKELLADKKECAEHLMLLDLGRNDVGRVTLPGSVKVTDSFFLEYYSHVMHIVSNVEGKLDPKFDEVDALMAGFPAGTVSGAPKVRAMEIIDQLEKSRRGIYAGCVGYFSADGNMDSALVLRTAVVKDKVMYVQAGAGIVTDSVPQNEFDECVNKAKALFRAADEAIRFANQGKKGQ